MAIQPRFSRHILSGGKGIEFRKRPLARDISTVLIYETAPTSCLVGAFGVESIIESSPAMLWSRFHKIGGIDADGFGYYFANSSRGFGIRIKWFLNFGTELPLDTLTPKPALPQSFNYLDAEIIDQLGALLPRPTGQQLMSLTHRASVPTRLSL